MLQTYFVRKAWINYFIVVDYKSEEKLSTSELSTPLKEEENDLFITVFGGYHLGYIPGASRVE